MAQQDDVSMAAENAAGQPDHPKSRLMIKEMVLENFKSYAGEQRVGPFHKVRALRQASLTACCVCLKR